MPKILIVDDEYSFAHYAKMILESAGFEVAVQLEGQKAQESAGNERPDLILMDMHLRDITGVEAIRSLKSDPKTKDVPVILCSITQSRSDVDEAIRQGAVDFIPKPLKLDELLSKIRRSLGRAAKDR